jgi:FKBP-type peptidyl-prolyl cis-trans isomerase (trigger factor)
VVAQFQRTVTLPGFRKGKAPAELVERQYAQPIREELLQRLTQQALEQAARDYDLKPVGPFEVKSANLSEADGLTLEAAVEVEPSFALASYRGIPLTQPSTDVTSEEMDKALAALRDSMAQLVPASTGDVKERKVPPLDDELAKDLGFESLEKLRRHVEAKLREQKRAAQAQAMEAALCEELLRRHAFEVPPRMVSRQTERVTLDFKARLLLAGTGEERLEEEVARFTQQLRTSAERHVKLAFILDRIATQESITVTQEELVKRLWQLAQRWKRDPAEVRKLFDAQGLWPSVVSTIRQEKTIARLLSAATVTPSTSDAHQQGGGA